MFACTFDMYIKLLLTYLLTWGGRSTNWHASPYIMGIDAYVRWAENNDGPAVKFPLRRRESGGRDPLAALMVPVAAEHPVDSTVRQTAPQQQQPPPPPPSNGQGK